MAFKMKNPSVAKLVKNASDNRKNKGQYSYYYHKKPDTLKTQPAKGMRSSNPSQTLALPRKNKTTKTFENISKNIKKAANLLQYVGPTAGRKIAKKLSEKFGVSNKKR